MNSSRCFASLGSGVAWLAWRRPGCWKEKEEGGHQAVIFGLLAGLLLIATWAIEALVPFEGWWQALRLTPAVVYGGLAYAFLTKGSGSDSGNPRTRRRHDGRAGFSLFDGL